MRDLWYYAIARALWIVWLILPHRHPVAGTKVRVSSYMHKYRYASDQHRFLGIVLGPEVDFRSPFSVPHDRSLEGVYSRGPRKWSGTWVVRLPDERGTLEQHVVDYSMEIVSGTRWGWPIFDLIMLRLRPDPRDIPGRRIGDLPYPIEYYPGDYVVYEGDETRRPRMVKSFWFELDGQLLYDLAETLEEKRTKIAALEEEAKRAGRSYGYSGGAETKYGHVPGSALTLSRRGNTYHLAEGEPGDLSFPHVTLEVDFWSGVGIWQSDHHQDPHAWPRLTIEEARAKLRSGEIDTIITGRETDYPQIRLPERYAKFRERSRAASLAYLDEHAGKHAFEVVSRETLAELRQCDF